MRLLVQLTGTGGDGPAGAGPATGAPEGPALLTLSVDGVAVGVPDDGSMLLDVLRDRLGARSPKDGCSPQGQCGCCTVWIDGAPRVSCVTPVRRIAGRAVTTLDGLPVATRRAWTDAMLATGASQCGFCTPGIIMRLAALADPGAPGAAARALAAHLCRCTGWQPILEAARLVGGTPAAPVGDPTRDLQAASTRALIEGGAPQQVGEASVVGGGGFAEDGAPLGIPVAVPRSRPREGGGPGDDGQVGETDGGDPDPGPGPALSDYVVGETLAAARAAAGKVQGRNSTVGLTHPVDPPPGPWALTLATTWVEPAYLEPDASWCEPGGRPADPCANGGAFGGKVRSPVAGVARRLADREGRALRVVWSREDTVRWGPKRPPVAGGIATDGTGILRVAVSGRTGTAEDRGGGIDAVRADVAAVAPGLVVETVPVAGPACATGLRAAVWAEAATLDRCARLVAERGPGPRIGVPIEVTAPSGGRAEVAVGAEGAISVRVEAGRVLDETVLRSYCVGATHQALSWVTSEGIAVDAGGDVVDLTLRSFGIVAARTMPGVSVTVLDGDGPAVNGSDAVFAAVAAAVWAARGMPPAWPTGATTDA